MGHETHGAWAEIGAEHTGARHLGDESGGVLAGRHGAEHDVGLDAPGIDLQATGAGQTLGQGAGVAVVVGQAVDVVADGVLGLVGWVLGVAVSGVIW